MTVKKNSVKFCLFIVLNVILIVVAYFLKNNSVRLNIPFFFFIQLVSVFYILIVFGAKPECLFSPSVLMIFYSCVNFILGGLAYNHDIYLSRDWYYGYLSLHNLGQITSFFLACNFIVFITMIALHNLINFNIAVRSNSFSHSSLFRIVFFMAVMILFWSFINLDLGFLGGGGSFSIVPKTLAALGLIICLYCAKIRLRWIYYISILVIFCVSNYESKREAIFLLLPILFLENVEKKHIKLRLKSFFLAISGIILVSYLIIIMTISRGFGGYVEKGDPLHAFKYANEFVKSDFFLAAYSTGLELSYFSFHNMQAMEYVITKKQHLMLGESFIKPLTIPIPRFIWKNKPMNATHYYTEAYDAAFLSEGGSYPVNIYVEHFFNFHILSLFSVLFIFSILNYSFFKLVQYIKRNGIGLYLMLPLFFYEYIMFYFRGSGLDLYLIYCIIAVLIYYLFYKIVIEIVTGKTRPYKYV